MSVSVSVDFSGQAVFEAGVALFEIATCLHPLLGYPSSCESHLGVVSYPFDAPCRVSRGLEAELASGGYPSGFTQLIRRMVACDVTKRPSLHSAAAELKALSVASL